MSGHAAGVLTRADIHNIRHYVQHKHGDLPLERRAEIVADAMQRIVLRQLPEFEAEQQRAVMHGVLREVVAEKGVPVGEAHIFEASMSLDIDRPDVILPLHKWTEKRLGAAIDFRLFREAVNEGKRIAADPSLGLTAWDAIVGAAGLHVEASLEERGEIALSGVVSSLPGTRRRRKAAVYLALSLVICTGMLYYGWRLLHPETEAVPRTPVVSQPRLQHREAKPVNALPGNLRFAEVDRGRLVHYLRAKESMLAEEPYLSAIIRAAQEFDIHPLLLFAITGQEQGFVPKTAKRAKEIANNPFNVFYSWEAYNTTIADSARIAGRTINRLSFERPANVDPVEWINREYAEDKNWSTGVNRILKSMMAQIMTDQ